jgi:hypothetical protein
MLVPVTFGSCYLRFLLPLVPVTLCPSWTSPSRGEGCYIPSTKNVLSAKKFPKETRVASALFHSSHTSSTAPTAVRSNNCSSTTHHSEAGTSRANTRECVHCDSNGSRCFCTSLLSSFPSAHRIISRRHFLSSHQRCYLVRIHQLPNALHHSPSSGTLRVRRFDTACFDSGASMRHEGGMHACWQRGVGRRGSYSGCVEMRGT